MATTPAHVTPCAPPSGYARRTSRLGVRQRGPRRLVATLVLPLGLVAAVLTVPAPTGHADPAPSIAQVEKRVADLDAQVDAAVEDYQEAQLQLAAARRTADVGAQRVQLEQSDYDALHAGIEGIAAETYRAGRSGALVSLVTTGSPQSYLARVSSLDQLARDRSQRLAAVGAAQHRLETAQLGAQRALAQQQAVQARVTERRAAIEKDLATSRALLGSLQAQERARLAEAQRVAAAQALAQRAAFARQAEAGVAAGYTGPASGRAGAAVAAAYAELGTPYEYGASGPSRFDCSGLTAWVWGKAGVALPHSSRAQFAGGRRVAQQDVQPGDLVFFGSPVHHVGIYVGGGQMIDAPHTGDVVRVQPAFRSDFVGAVRP